MGIQVDYSGLDELQQRLPEIEAAIAAALTVEIEAEIRQGWSAESPSAAGDPPAQVTGELAASVETQQNGMNNSRIGTSLEYGPMLEFGTAEMAARPWLRPAVERVRQRLQEIVTQAFAGMSANQGLSDSGGESGDDFGVASEGEADISTGNTKAD